MALRVVKTLFWFFVGLAVTGIVARIFHGPGSVTALTDILPWGLWKGGGVVALVAIGGAGFTLAMFVYIFQWKRYKPLIRGAVLLGLLCYTSVGIGLTFDIGIWWRIVYPLWHWQLHSVLFEVAWCIMLYLGVLALEFGHTVLERFKMERALSILGKFTLVLVIAGISLSTLHQSSLGTLFLATPFRLHPLWHTDLLPLLFFISAIGIGCLTISLVTLFAHKLYDVEPPMHAISGLARISAFVLTAYVVLRLGEIVVAGETGLLFAGSWDTVNFWLELCLSGFLPIAFLSQREFRESKTAMFWICLTATVGISLNRVNVSGLATLSLTDSFYFPAWTEWVVTLGILSGAGLVFLFAMEHLGLFEGVSKERVVERYEPGHLDHTDWAALFFGTQRFGEIRVYSTAFVFGIALCFGLLPDRAVYGVAPTETPTFGIRTVEALKVPIGESASGTSFLIGRSESDETEVATDVLLIDANRNGDYVLFDHDGHSRSLGEPYDPNTSCGLCHHMNKPLDKNTGCSECHTDMYLAKDVFNHEFHANELGGNDGCVECHTDPNLPKLRENTTDCLECHSGMRSADSRVNITDPAKQFLASGYMTAMHELCIKCHEERQPTLPVPNEHFARCSNCHQGLPSLDDEVWKQTSVGTAAHSSERPVSTGRGR